MAEANRRFGTRSHLAGAFASSLGGRGSGLPGGLEVTQGSLFLILNLMQRPGQLGGRGFHRDYVACFFLIQGLCNR